MGCASSHAASSISLPSAAAAAVAPGAAKDKLRLSAPPSPGPSQASTECSSTWQTDGEGRTRAISESSSSEAGSDDDGRINRAQFILDNTGDIRKFYKMSTSRLGEGAFGCVSKATHRTTGVVRAVKQIQTSQVADVQGFRQEVAMMKMMDHPNIIRLFETFEDRRNVYLLMELCEGGELFDRIVSLRRLSEAQALLVMQDVLRAVAYMHRKDIVHRDLKPENFLLMNAGPICDNSLKLIDFGTACRCTERQVLSTKVGTAYYIAPQVLQRRYGRECDLWSAGALMYTILSGSAPFPGTSDKEVLAKVRSGKYNMQHPAFGKVTPEAKDLIRMLLHVNPRARYSAEKALNHKWIANAPPRCPPVALAEEDMERIRTFRDESKLKKAVLQIVAGQLKESKLRRLRNQFISLDADGDGQLSVEELRQGAAQAGLERTRTDLLGLHTAVDLDNSGAVEYTEFLAACLDQPSYLDQGACWTAFNVFDLNKDGVIDSRELAQVLKGAGSDAILQDVDFDGDGKINFEEFMSMMRK